MQNQKRAIGILFLLGLIGAILAVLWWPQPNTHDEPDEEATPSAQNPAPLQTRKRATTASPSQTQTGEQPVPSDASPAPAKARFDAAVAEEFGLLHVSCFVGEEFSDLPEVQDGWYSGRHRDWSGTARFGADGSSEASVTWNAPSEAKSTRCVLTPIRWAELTVKVFEEDGTRAAGVGVLFCGGMEETDKDGELTVQILADNSCEVHVMRAPSGHPKGLNLASEAMIRVAPMAEHSQHEVSLPLRDIESYAKGYRQDRDPDEEFEVGVVQHFEYLPPRSDEEQLAYVRERYAAKEADLSKLERARAKLPEEDRWAADAELEREERELDRWKDAIEEAEERLNKDGDPSSKP